MAKFEMGKSVEAVKVNKRSGIPTTEKVTISFGAIIEDPREERDKIRFSHLGEVYDVPESEVRGFIKPIGGGPALQTAAAAPAAAAAAPDSTPQLEWEKLGGAIPLNRTKVPGGWLVAGNQGLTFVPDSAYEWLKA